MLKEQLEEYLEQGRVKSKNSEHDEAVIDFQKAMKIAISIYGEENEKVLDILDNLASEYRRIQNYDFAIEYSLKAIELKKKISDDHLSYVLDMYDRLIFMCEIAGLYKKALELYKIYLEKKAEYWNYDKDPDIFNDYHKIIDLYLKDGQYENAYKYVKKVYDDEASYAENIRLEYNIEIDSYVDINMINLYVYIPCLCYKLGYENEFAESKKIVTNMINKFNFIELNTNSEGYWANVYGAIALIFWLMHEKDLSNKYFQKSGESQMVDNWGRIIF